MPTTIRRQHPVTVLYFLYRQIRQLVIPLAYLLFTEIKGDTGSKPYWVYAIAALYTVYIIGRSCWSWYKSVYYVEDNVLHIKSGIAKTQHRSIPIQKINNFDTEQNFLYRLLGVSTLSLQTSDSDSSADAKFAISKSRVNELVGFLTTLDTTEKRAENKKVQVGLKELFMMSISSDTLLLGVPIAGPVLQWIFKHTGQGDPEDARTAGQLAKDGEFDNLLSPEGMLEGLTAMSISIGLLLVISAFVSIFVVLIRYYNWTVQREDDVLIIEYGLFSKRVARLSVPKIQSIRVKEKPLSRYFGYVSVYVDSIGYTGSRKILIPSIKKEQMRKVVEDLCPEFDLTENLDKCDARGKNYFSAEILAFPTLVVLGLSLFTPYILFALLVFVAWFYLRQLRYSQNGWAVHKNQLIIHRRGISRTTVYVLRKAIQSIYLQEEWAMRRPGIQTVSVDLDSPAKGREYAIHGLNVEQTDKILSWYKNK